MIESRISQNSSGIYGDDGWMDGILILRPSMPQSLGTVILGISGNGNVTPIFVHHHFLWIPPKTWEKERILVFSSFLATTIHLKIALTTHDTDENPTCGQWIPNMWVCFSSRC